MTPAYATRYRAVVTQAFVAELLSPFEAVDAMLADDYDDDERRHAVAERFGMSPMVVDTLLVHHGRLQREDPERDLDVAAA